jgi:hypothetical protein
VSSASSVVKTYSGIPPRVSLTRDFANVEGRLSPSLRAIRVELIAFPVRRLLVRIADVQFAMSALRLHDHGALSKLPRFAAKARLMFAFATRICRKPKAISQGNRGSRRPFKGVNTSPGA